MLERVFLIMLPVCVAGCGPSRPPTASPAACETRLPQAAPNVQPAPALAEPESRVALDVSVETERLSQELAERVPTTLATASRRPIGAAGLVSYTVVRGAFGFGIDRDRLIITTPIRANVEVCKPFGPFCVTYGRCTPELLSSVSVPLMLERDFGLSKSLVSVRTTRPCKIAGFDATPYVERAAEDQRADIQRQVDAALPDPRPSVAAAWKLLDVPLALGIAPCLRVEPRRIEQAHPARESGRIRARVVVHGLVAVEAPCRSQKRAATPPPPPEVAERAPEGIALELPLRMGYEEVSAELSRSLASARPENVGRIRQAKARAGAVSGKSRLIIALTLDGAVCGDAWIVAEPYYDTASNGIRLRRAALYGEQRALSDSGLSSALTAAVERHARIGLSVDVTAAPAQLERLVESAAPSLPPGVRAKLELSPARVTRVALDDQALVPVASIGGTARLDVVAR
jgi:hypothetical protein